MSRFHVFILLFFSATSGCPREPEIHNLMCHNTRWYWKKWVGMEKKKRGLICEFHLQALPALSSWQQLPGFSPFVVAPEYSCRLVALGDGRRRVSIPRCLLFLGPRHANVWISFRPFVLSTRPLSFRHRIGGSEEVRDGLGVNTDRDRCRGGGDLQLLMN